MADNSRKYVTTETASKLYKPLGSVRVIVMPTMVGFKRAIIDKDVLYVSPAMHDLLRHAETHDELAHIIKSIPVLDISEYHLDLNQPLPISKVSYAYPAL